jgi:DNA invertase Pin-like site-specific DNA recombinase
METAMEVTRAAIWCRVSTSEQDNSNQELLLQEMASRRGLDVVKVYSVEASAFTGKQNPALRAAMEDARRGMYEVLLVFALDRLSREGCEATLRCIREFRERGVRVLSLNEAWTDGPEAMQDLLGSLFAWMAQQESGLRSARVRAGLRRRAEAGLPLGRQKGAVDLRPRRRAGYFLRQERERENVTRA